jgi:hypothetical protein
MRKLYILCSAIKSRRKRHTMRFILCSLALALAASAQVKPNFSGTWKQNNARSTVRPDSTFLYSNEISHQDANLAVTTIINGGGRPEAKYLQTYAIDGRPHANRDRDGHEFTAVVKWDGDVLVFQAQTGPVKVQETWALSENGRTLTKKRHTSGLVTSSDQVFVLELQ